MLLISAGEIERSLEVCRVVLLVRDAWNEEPRQLDGHAPPPCDPRRSLLSSTTEKKFVDLLVIQSLAALGSLDSRATGSHRL